MFRMYKYVMPLTCPAARSFTSLQGKSGSIRRGLLKINFSEGSRRCMSGHGPDISKLQATLAILVGGGAFAWLGMYQANSMRNRIENYETGKITPFKTMTDEEYLSFKEKYHRLHSEEEESDEEDAANGDEEPESEDSDSSVNDSSEIEKPSKDTIIFIDAPEEEN